MSRINTIEREIARTVRGVADRELGSMWPSPRWKPDPVGFAWHILGVELWAFQRDFVENIRDHRHVSVSGGRKIGKDFGVGCGALWWYSSRTRAGVFMLAPTGKQLNGILYKEVRMLWAEHGRCVKCKKDDPTGPRPCPHSAIMAGRVSELAQNGIKSTDFRQIMGATAVSEGGLRGFSGADVLAIEDEAADIKDDLDTALVGNLASGDCHRVLISNPTRTSGFFYRSHHEERALYKTMQVDTETNPNVIEGREVFKGLATRQWLAEREAAWGRDSPLWEANVGGRFVKAEAGQLFSLEAVAVAERRWLEQDEEAEAFGRLTIGIDVAGESGLGDEYSFVPRRGRRMLDLQVGRGLKYEAYVDRAREFITHWRRPGDFGENRPCIVVDRDGEEGAKVWLAFRAYHERDEGTLAEFELIGFRGSAPAPGSLSLTYRFARDALFAGLLDAFKDGLGIVSDTKLEAELTVLRWLDVERGRSQLMHKSEIKEKLKRSPDRLDGLALSCWSERRKPIELSPPEAPPPPPRKAIVEDVFEERAENVFDPYAAMDPYGGGGRRDDD